jgi:hypothetical protein
MATIQPTLQHAAMSGVSISAAGTAATGPLTGDWVPTSGLGVNAIAVQYIEANGTMTQVALTFEVLIAGDPTTVYVLQTPALAVFTITIAAAGNAYIPLCPTGANASCFPPTTTTYIRAVGAVTGTGGVGDVVIVTFCGARALP